MRLWHEALIPYLSTQRLLGQHRECCALRGNGWGRKHATVNYVFEHHSYTLFLYHMKIIDELERRNIHIDNKWHVITYRGKYCQNYNTDYLLELWTYAGLDLSITHYPEHNDEYLQECLNLLERKGEHIEWKSTK